MLDVLFGRDTPSGESDHLRGALRFWDVIPQIEGESLMVEIMTPHQTRYYQDGASPNESGSPNPISFLTVPPGSRFVFHVQCDLALLGRHDLGKDARWKELLSAAFEHAFRWLGFGAKTAVGYGAMTQLAPGAPGTESQREPATPQDKALPAPSKNANETRWESAQLKFNSRNGTLTAVGPSRAEAHAYSPKGGELPGTLPTPQQVKLRNGQPVKVVATVSGRDLLRVEVPEGKA